MNFFPESDDLAETLNAPVDHSRAAQVAAATEARVGFVEKCPKCHGRGVVTIGYAHRRQVSCFGCKGQGNKTSKQPAAKRAQARVNAQANKERKLADALAAFKAEYPQIWSWMDGNDFRIAVELKADLLRYGSLTEGKVALALRMVEKRNAALANAQQAREERISAAPVIEMAKIEEAFQHARQDIQKPKLRLAGLVISHAPATGQNAGALYVKADGVYAGKIVSGRFIASRECTDSMKDRLLATAADPKAAAVAYGRETGSCSCCGRLLTDPVSIANGIGPICAGNFGW